jgi:hypothetical protein
MMGGREEWESQVFSIRKMLLRGALVAAMIWRGTWSEIGRAEEVRVVSGRAKLHSGLTRMRSRRARMGGVLLVGPSELTIKKGDLKKPHGVDGLVEDGGLSKIEVVI